MTVFSLHGLQLTRISTTSASSLKDLVSITDLQTESQRLQRKTLSSSSMGANCLTVLREVLVEVVVLELEAEELDVLVGMIYSRRNIIIKFSISHVSDK